MNRENTCLLPEQVTSLLEGDLKPDESKAVEHHLSQCDSCREFLDQAVGPDQWWDEVQQSLGDANRKTQESLEVSRDRLASGVWESEPATSLPTDRLLDLLGPSDDPSMLGRIGNYEVTGLLGQGGMGVVFKGFDRSLNRFVAIKMLLPHLATSGAARQRFAREAQATAAVVDDHVMPVLCVDEWQGIPYLVMTYSKGVSLQKRLNDMGTLQLREILRIGSQAAKGLAAAHTQGLVHRDIKPANIFLSESVERVQLMDFGLARAADDASLTRTGILAGTPQYMSPEQARAEKVDWRSDLFSLGSVLYTMCTGRAPFRAESSHSVLRLITDKTPRPIREINPEIPTWLCRIIDRLMAKSAADRYQSSEEVAELLEACLAHVQQPDSVALPEAVQSGGNRRFSGIWIAAALAGFAILVGGFLLSKSKPLDISGTWQSDQWGMVELTAGDHARHFTGTITPNESTLSQGKVDLEWSRIERQYNGSWELDDGVGGTLSVQLVDDQIVGSFSTNRKARKKLGAPKQAGLTWTRANGPAVAQSDDDDDNIVQSLEKQALDFYSKVKGGQYETAIGMTSESLKSKRLNDEPLEATLRELSQLSSKIKLKRPTVAINKDSALAVFPEDASPQPTNGQQSHLILQFEKEKDTWRISDLDIWNKQHAMEALRVATKQLSNEKNAVEDGSTTVELSSGDQDVTWILTLARKNNRPVPIETFETHARLLKSTLIIQDALASIGSKEPVEKIRSELKVQLGVGSKTIRVSMTRLSMDRTSKQTYDFVKAIVASYKNYVEKTHDEALEAARKAALTALEEQRKQDTPTSDHIRAMIKELQSEKPDDLQVVFLQVAPRPYLPKAPLSWQQQQYSPPNAAYFPDDKSSGIALDKLWNANDRESRSDEEILETVRNGLRNTKEHRTLILGWIGNKYIWNKAPQNAEAIELMYHASDFKADTQHYAVYFGLSVVQPKTSSVLKALAELGVTKTDDHNTLGRIAWGCSDQKEELLRYVKEFEDQEKQEWSDKAIICRRIFSGELNAFEWAKDKARTLAEEKYRKQLPEIKQVLVDGSSAWRLATLQLILRDRVYLIMDDSFVKSFAKCATDENPEVRKNAVIIVGEHWIWRTRKQNTDAIEMMMKLSDDKVRSVKYNAVYYGLSVLREKSEEHIQRLLEIAMTDHEPNMFGRIKWGLREDKDRATDLLYRVIQNPKDQEQLKNAVETFQKLVGRNPSLEKRQRSELEDLYRKLGTGLKDQAWPVDEDNPPETTERDQ